MDSVEPIVGTKRSELCACVMADKSICSTPDIAQTRENASTAALKNFMFRKRKTNKKINTYHGESITTYLCTNKSTLINEDINSTFKKTIPELLTVPTVSASPNVVSNTKKTVFASKCPFYKWIAGTSITVDAFRYGLLPECRAYFLSHFHYDHYGGLKSSFSGPIYCSSVTKGLLLNTFGNKLNVVALEMNTVYSVCEVDVTLIDANHCPGSVMFLFHIRDQKKYILHTGDFRFSPEMLNEESQLHRFVNKDTRDHLRLQSIYLDTTYCSPNYDFAPQSDVIEEAVLITGQHLTRQSSTLVVCGMYSIGKERFVLGLAKRLDLQVWLSPKQRKLVEVAAEHGCHVCQELVKRTVSLPNEASLHVLPMQQINRAFMSAYCREKRTAHKSTTIITTTTTGNTGSRQTTLFGTLAAPAEDRLRPILAWRPTGWTHRQQGNNGSQRTLHDDGESAEESGSITLEHTGPRLSIYGAAYSEHSSFCELKEFVMRLKPVRIQQTVFSGAASSCKDYLNAWNKTTETPS